jgi:hypothetical protein
MPIFDLCLVADDVRIEVGNKASIIDYYGRLPHVQIQVAQPTLPIYKLVFLFISTGPVAEGRYGVRLSVTDPSGHELMRPEEATTGDTASEVLNTIISCLPFPLSGVGIYRITAIVNGHEDFSSTLEIQQAPVLPPD